jgi:hypothetical protein
MATKAGHEGECGRLAAIVGQEGDALTLDLIRELAVGGARIPPGVILPELTMPI